MANYNFDYRFVPGDEVTPVTWLRTYTYSETEDTYSYVDSFYYDLDNVITMMNASCLILSVVSSALVILIF